MSPAPEPQVAPEPAPEDSWPSSTPPADLPANPTQADAAAYAWQQFLALSWPVTPGQRGVPNTGVAFGSPGTVVWESWKADYEVFLADGSTPVPWNDYGAGPSLCAGASPGDRVFHRISKSPHDSDTPVFERMEQAVGGSLTDQHGNLARYELRMNQVEFTDITTNNLYNIQGQEALTGPLHMTNASMEIKASWRQMTAQDGPNVRARFYIINAWVYTPPLGTAPASCAQWDMGLVGLHITQKTPTRPQWTWATFEQVDNVPPFGTETAGPIPYSFNNPSCSVADCPPNQSTQIDGLPTTTPTQVTRVIGIGSDAVAANATNQAALAAQYPSAPWQYYELVGIQWPRQPAMPTGDPTPGNMGNTTLETYLGADSSCVDCHFKAKTAATLNPQTSDFSFMLAEAQAATSVEKTP